MKNWSLACVATTVGLVSASGVAGQVGRVSVYEIPETPPGVNGPYTFGGLDSLRVNNGGRLVFGATLRRENAQDRYGVFVMGGGVPLTNVLDTNTDTVAAEFGTDGVAGITRSYIIRDDNTLRLNASLDTPFPAADGIDSTNADLEWSGAGRPVVSVRRTADIFVPGNVVSSWHGTFFSPDETEGWVFNGSTTFSSESLWPIEPDGTLGALFMQHLGPASTNGGDLPGRPNASIRFPDFPTVGDSGSVAFRARLRTNAGDPETSITFFGRKGEGYGPLFDPRETATEFLGAFPGYRVSGALPLGITDSDAVRVYATFINDGTNISDGHGIWSFRDDGLPGTLLLQVGRTAPGLEPGERIRFPLQSATTTRSVAMIEGSHMRVLSTAQDASGEQRYVEYNIAPDDTVTPVFFSTDTFEIPGASGGPFVITSISDRDIRWTDDGRLVAQGSIEDTTDSTNRASAILYVDDTGTVRTLAVTGQMFDFGSSPTGGQRVVQSVDLGEVSSGGKVVFGVRPVGGSNEPFRYAVADINAPLCPADTNGDGAISPADFTAWVIAFNGQTAACDQNGDGLCTPADFTAFILGYNAGCP
ncbi:MAG: GC-type dockerin domain-anchored protein [Planctomycetota bacterium]